MTLKVLVLLPIGLWLLVFLCVLVSQLLETPELRNWDTMKMVIGIPFAIGLLFLTFASWAFVALKYLAKGGKHET